MHFWDLVALFPSRTPYVTTFEDFLPRHFAPDLLSRGIESLCSPRCRRMIAFSDAARNGQAIFNKRHGMEGLDKKISVLLPPQAPLLEPSLVEKRSYRVLKFILVGRDLFRKGGAEAIRALAEIRRSYPVEIFVIGDFDHVDYASSSEVDRKEEMHKLIEANSWIHWFPSLQNSRVLALAKECNIGLLPTRDDTFGYSVLEFQACGLPCISTDIRSLPEINNDDVGWTLAVPKNNWRYADFSSPEAIRKLSATIQSGLKETLLRIVARPDCVVEKGIAALNQITHRHSPEIFGKRLEEIYRQALDG